MPLSIAEYLGQRTDVDKRIMPAKTMPIANCPFSNMPCDKIVRGYHPVCCMRRGGELWIVCEHRLCSSHGGPLMEYQRDKLYQIGKEIYGSKIPANEFIFKKEVALPVEGTRSVYHADFILSAYDGNPPGHGPGRVIVEVQGGGETSSTGTMTRHLDKWHHSPSNKFLREDLNMGIIQTNAWRRQQEQLLVKGHIASQSGYGIVLCLGGILYDYVKGKLKGFDSLRDLSQARWDFSLLTFEGNKSKPKPGPIEFVINKEKRLFTSFHTFTASLVTQGGPLREAFIGEYETLDGRKKVIS